MEKWKEDIDVCKIEINERRNEVGIGEYEVWRWLLQTPLTTRFSLDASDPKTD